MKEIAMTTGPITMPQVHLLYIDILSRHIHSKGAYGNVIITNECMFSGLRVFISASLHSFHVVCFLAVAHSQYKGERPCQLTNHFFTLLSQ